MKKNEIRDRIAGALYGVAIGDALGGPLEFMNKETIAERLGRVTEMIGGGWLELAPGETTDDTAMTLAVAEGILEDPEMPYQAIGRKWIGWYYSGPKDIGNACAASIENAIRNGGDWWEASRQTQVYQGHPVEGNGALMRTIYPALYYTDEKKRRLVTRGIALMTHAGPKSTDICEEYVEIVRDLIMTEGKAVMAAGFYKALTEPTGYVVDSYSNAIEAVAWTRNFEDAVVAAVNQGGDADTIGAIAGGLAGAKYGYSQIPKRWIDSLDHELCWLLDFLAEEAWKQHE